MLIFDDIYSWEGWGGKMKLGSGKCRLRIFDLKKDAKKGLSHLRPIIVIVSDIPDSKMSVKSCAGHIATHVTKDFNIDPHRMIWIEYYPQTTYGVKNEFTISEKIESVEFEWHDDNAIYPKWREVNPQMAAMIKELIDATPK